MQDASITDLLRQLLAGMVKETAFTATVEAVSMQDNTCDLKDAKGYERLGVRLVPVAGKMGGSYVVVYPKVGSTVTCLVTDGQESRVQIVGVTEIDSVKVKAMAVEVASDSIIVNGGSNGGMANTPVLRTELEKLRAFMQTIQQAISSAPVVPQDGGASFKAALSVAIGSLPLPDYSNIEDPKFKH